MANLAATDVAYVQVNLRRIGESGLKTGTFDVSFGDGVKTYPAGGVPLLRGSLAAPAELVELEITDPANANGYVYKFDATNEKVRIYQAPGSLGPLVEVTSGSFAPAATTLRVHAEGW